MANIKGDLKRKVNLAFMPCKDQNACPSCKNNEHIETHSLGETLACIVQLTMAIRTAKNRHEPEYQKFIADFSNPNQQIPQDLVIRSKLPNDSDVLAKNRKEELCQWLDYLAALNSKQVSNDLQDCLLGVFKGSSKTNQEYAITRKLVDILVNNFYLKSSDRDFFLQNFGEPHITYLPLPNASKYSPPAESLKRL